MIPEFTTLFEPGRWAPFVLISARVGGLMMTAPMWSMTALPRTARAALTVVLSVMLLPAFPAVSLPEETLALPVPLAMEGLVGIAIGLTAAVLVQALAVAGEVLSLQMGLSIGPALAPTPDVQSSGVAQFQTILGLLLYTSIGGHLMLLQALADSLRLLPPGSGFTLAAGAAPLTALLGTLFACAVRAAAPVMVALLLTNVAIALLSRAVPQLNAMMVSFPLTIAVGLIMFGLSIPVLSGVVVGWMEALPEAAQATLRAFSPAAGS